MKKSLRFVMSTLAPAFLSAGVVAGSAMAQDAPKAAPAPKPFVAGRPLGVTLKGAYTPMSSNVKVYGAVVNAESCSYDAVRGLIVVPNRGAEQHQVPNDGFVSLLNRDGSGFDGRESIALPLLVRDSALLSQHERLATLLCFLLLASSLGRLTGSCALGLGRCLQRRQLGREPSRGFSDAGSHNFQVGGVDGSQLLRQMRAGDLRVHQLVEVSDAALRSAQAECRSLSFRNLWSV